MQPRSDGIVRWAATTGGATLLALGALAGVAAGPAVAATLIQMCPYTITVPDLYVLARDLDCPPATASPSPRTTSPSTWAATP